MFVLDYDRAHAAAYAKRWALGRNPLFYDFEDIGGDCTSFVSQCVLAGSCQMNFTPTYGWYFRGPNDRSASWSGVQYFYDFMTGNQGLGPFAREVGAGDLKLGDVIQLGRSDGSFYHSLVVTGFIPGSYLVSAHTYDHYNRPLYEYYYARARFLHIEGVRCDAKPENCFPRLMYG